MSNNKLVVVAVSTFVLSLATQMGWAQVNTFTSGGPPLGDGNDYPRSLNRTSQAAGGGASVDAFSTDLVGYTNSNFNPAFFDSNNLLTRPAALINGDAFWTDPKLGTFNNPGGDPFQLAQIGFEFFDASFESFGFDIAVASASGSVPATLPFQIQDYDSDGFGFGELILDPNSGGGFGEIYPADAGSFFTLGGRQGREARYRIEKYEIEDLIGQPLSGGSWYLDIDLEGVATLGGTNQVAIDNFVLDNATLPQPGVKPVYLPPTPPVGPNRPQYFNYAETTNDQTDGDTYDFTDAELLDELVNLFVTGNPDSDGLNLPSISVTFDGSNISNGLVGHDLTVSPVPNQDEFWENMHILNDQIGVQLQNILDQIGPLPPEYPSDVTRQILHIESLLVETDLTALLVAEMTNAIEPSVLNPEDLEAGFVNVVEPFSDDSAPGHVALLTSGAVGSDQAIEAVIAAVVSPNAMHYLNYTVDDYIALKESLNEPWYEGDAGSFVTPVYGDSGEIETYSVSTWTISSQSGLFAPVLVGAQIPEPRSVVLIVACLSAMAVRHRWRWS